VSCHGCATCQLDKKNLILNFNLNYNLYMHVKIIFIIFIDQITPSNYSNYYFFTCVKISSVTNYKWKCKK